MSGLENPLFVLVVVGLATVLARAAARGTLLSVRPAVIVGLLAAAAALTRPDGLVYGLAFPFAVLLLAERERVRTALRAVTFSTIAFVVPVGLYVLLRFLVFGDVLPNTARAKEQGVPSAADFSKPADLIAYAGWAAVLVAVALVAVVLSRPGPARRVLAVLLIPLLLGLLAFAVLRPDWMAQFRFATPIWALGALTVTVALAEVFPGLGPRPRLLGAAVVAAVTVLSLFGWSQNAAVFRASPTAPLCYVALDSGYTINHYADMLRIEQGTLLAVDAGGTALTSRLRLVDLAGLADAPIARFWEHDDMAGLRDHVFVDVRPTFIKLWSGWDGNVRSGLLADPRMARDYVLVLSPGPRTGTWVRRDAVPDPQALASTQRWARSAFAAVSTSFSTPTTERWSCGPVLRPGGPFPDLT